MSAVSFGMYIPLYTKSSVESEAAVPKTARGRASPNETD
jgi:hypothetical protein